MATVAPIQTSFSGGEFDPTLLGRVDADRYRQALAKCLNFIPTVQGPLDRRPGTYYVAATKYSDKKARLVPFQFSADESYILEFGHQYIRFFRDHGQILSGMVPYEISSPYEEDEVPLLAFAQSNDVLYITSPQNRPLKLQRYGDTDWQLSPVFYRDGPYYPTNGTAKTLTASGTTGLVNIQATQTVAVTNIVASPSGVCRVTAAGHRLSTGDRVNISGVTGTVEANNSVFPGLRVIKVSDDVFDLPEVVFVNAYIAGGTIRYAIFGQFDQGRLIRFKGTSTWGWGEIVALVDPQTATVQIKSALDAIGPTTAWRLGFWRSDNSPTAVGFHEDRLWFSGAAEMPQRIDGSNSSDYENFAPTQLDGTVTDSNALSFNLNSSDLNQMRWLVSDEKGLVGGSSANEWTIRPSLNSEAMTPTNIMARRTTAWGSANIAAILVGKATIFVQRGAKLVRELLFYFDIDGYRSTDLSELSRHITGEGVTAMAYQKLPQSILWFARSDGALIGMTYERDTQNLKVGWHRHFLGGSSDSAGTPAAVESIAVIPSPDGGTRDELWAIVQRYINGGTVRYVEYLGKIFEDTDLQEDAHFVDCGAVYDAPIAINAISQANPGVVTSVAPLPPSINNGDQIVFREVKGMTEVNYKRYTVANKGVSTFELKDSSGNNIDTTLFSAYISGGYIRKLVSSISGLGFLEGQSVQIQGDGAAIAPQTVTAGVVTLPSPVATAHIGLGYNSDAQMLPLEAGAANGSAVGKTRRIHRIAFMLHRTLGFKFGPSENNLAVATFKAANTAPNIPAPLFTGIFDTNAEMGYDYENKIFMRQDQPLPCKILAVAVHMQTQDRQ